MNDGKTSNNYHKLVGEDGKTTMMIQESETRQVLRKGNKPKLVKYVTILVPHSISEQDEKIVDEQVKSYRERGYNVNLMHSGNESLNECILNLLHNNRYVADSTPPESVRN